MPKLPYTITDRSISVLVGNKMRVLDSSSMNFTALRDALRSGEHDVAMISELVDITSFVARVTCGAVQISDGEVRWNGATVHNVVAERLIALLKEGSDIKPLAKFLAKLLTNPTTSTVDELYLWLETSNLPITDDGNFIAWKKVRNDYMDIYSGRVSYVIGSRPSMPRERVDPDRNRTCSQGLHFCSFSYLGNFSSHRSNDRVIIVEIDPADVVAIPRDYDNAKGRTWRMSVIGEVPEEDCEHFFRGTNVYDGPTYAEVGSGGVRGQEEEGESVTGCMAVDEDEDGEDYFDDEDVVVFGPVEEDEPSPVEPATTVTEGLIFKRGDQTFTAEHLLDLVEQHGQRGLSNLTGVPRTTLQEWLARARQSLAQ